VDEMDAVVREGGMAPDGIIDGQDKNMKKSEKRGFAGDSLDVVCMLDEENFLSGSDAG